MCSVGVHYRPWKIKGGGGEDCKTKIPWWTSACHLRPSARAPWITGSLLHCLEPKQLNSVLTGFGLQSRWSEQERLLLGRSTGGWRLSVARGPTNGSRVQPCWELGNPFFPLSTRFHCSLSPACWAAINPAWASSLCLVVNFHTWFFFFSWILQCWNFTRAAVISNFGPFCVRTTVQVDLLQTCVMNSVKTNSLLFS